MKKLLLAALIATVTATTAHAGLTATLTKPRPAVTVSNQMGSNITGYVRAREFAMRFTRVIKRDGPNTYTIGREDEPDARRLRVEGGSRKAWASVTGTSRTLVRLPRGVKVDSRGLLLPPSVLVHMGCRVKAESASSLRVTCDGVTYSLARYR